MVSLLLRCVSIITPSDLHRELQIEVQVGKFRAAKCVVGGIKCAQCYLIRKITKLLQQPGQV